MGRFRTVSFAVNESRYIRRARIGWQPPAPGPPPAGGWRLPPSLVSREDVDQHLSRAGLGHHRGHGLAPRGVMGGRFVLGGVVRAAIGLDQGEARRVIGVLKEVETSYAGLLDAVAGIFQRRRAEGADRFGQ